MNISILGVPLEHLVLCFIITTIFTIYFFFPALSDFGGTLFGEQDIQFFLWLFWHYEHSFDNGTNPLIANEIFYPEGVTLVATTITPFQAILYLLVPDAWGPFGKITFLQVLSFILGGLFSFMLVYRFTKSFVPSLLGSFVYNFSAFHFEKAVHHLNWNMALPFLALFFIFYYSMLEQPKRNRTLVWLSLSLLLVALNELTVAIMAGFIIFLDIYQRYLKQSGIEIFSPKNTLMMGLSLIASLLLFELFSALSLPPAVVYTMPSSIFLSVCLFGILGRDNLMKEERRSGYFTSMAISAIPIVIYMAVLATYPIYQFKPDSILMNLVEFPTSIEYLILPSTLQEISHLGLFEGLAAMSDTGSYIGPIIILLTIISWRLPKASEEEGYFRNMFLLCLLFSFPLMVWNDIIVPTPFVSGALFPFLALLRVQSRFMLFALLFLSVMIGLLSKRLLSKLAGWRAWALALLLMTIIIAERWPAMETVRFDAKVPQFYAQLANESNDIAIYLYPNFNYASLLKEVYYQTKHEKKISYGVLSRFPAEGNQLYSDYMKGRSLEELFGFIHDTGYDYVVVQKLRCGDSIECFYGNFSKIDPEELEEANEALEKEFGEAVYEDGSMVVYDAKVNATNST